MLDHYPEIASNPATLHYLERLTRRGRQGRTIYNYANAVNHFLVWCKENEVRFEAVQPWQIEEYFDSKADLQASTKQTHLTQLRAVYRFAHRRGLVPMDPTYDVELPAVPVKKPHILSVDELRGMRNKAYNERQWMLFHLLAYTGARRDEVRRMAWGDVSLQSNTIYVLGKGAKERLIPVHPILGDLLSEQHPGRLKEQHALVPGPYGRSLATSSLEKLFKGFKGQGTTFHDFRRTVASNLDANGVPEGVIMRIMGWAPRSIFDKHYRHVADERLQKGIIALYSNDPL